MTPLHAARRSAAGPSFERLYRKHVHAVYRYVLAVLQNEADAEDVTQTTFLNAYRAIQRGERPHTPHNWLIKIAHNACRERFRESSRRPREVVLEDALVPAPAEDADVPTATEIRRALGFLAFNQRAALVMRELEGRSYAEIAQVLDVSVSAVETLMFRARRALREQLEGGLTCDEAEETLDRLQSRKLTSAEQGALRAHLRECKACATLERRQRAQRAAFDRLRAVPLPASLGSFAGGGAGGGAVGGGLGLGLKVASVLAAGLVVTSVGHEPLRADATDKRAAATKRVALGSEAASPNATVSRIPVQARTFRRTRRRMIRARVAASRTRARSNSAQSSPIPTAPTPGEARSQAPPPAAAPPPPPLQIRVPVQPPPVQLPQLPLPPPPIPLPPPPIQLPPPPIQLPPPPPLPLPPPLHH